MASDAIAYIGFTPDALRAYGAIQSANETNYIFLIHGTFAAPKQDQGRRALRDIHPAMRPFLAPRADPQPQWYQEGSEFREQLAEKLAEQQLKNLAWREFAWSGENDHFERLKAAKKLAAMFKEIQESDKSARIHVIAHSHGGNVLLQAAEIHLRRYSIYQNRFGQFVFLGTPFMRKHWLQNKQNRAAFNPLYNLKKTAVASAAAAAGMYYFLENGWKSYASPQFILTSIAIIAGIWLVLAMIFKLFYKLTYFNTNLYFSEIKNARRVIGFDPGSRIDAAVYSAGFLDEALLSLSSYDILNFRSKLMVRRFFLKKRIIADFYEGILVDIEGITSAFKLQSDSVLVQFPLLVSMRVASAKIFGAFVNIFSRTIHLIVYFISFPWRYLTYGAFSRLFVTYMSARALGLPLEELRNARVEIFPTLNIDWAFKENFKDVSRAVGEALSQQVSSGSVDYEYLFNDVELDRRIMEEDELFSQNPNAEENELWGLMKSNLRALHQEYIESLEGDRHQDTIENPDAIMQEFYAWDGPPNYTGSLALDQKEFDRKFYRLWLASADRIREMAASIELVHSRYYKRPDVVSEIADHIVDSARRVRSGLRFSGRYW